ncbi:MAG: NADP-dependent oxidoreductase [Novosphingobium sp.]
MKAFILDGYGHGKPLRFGDLPQPELKDTDVLVEIHAASVNPIDYKIRSGEFKLILPFKLPVALGSDLAGVVVKVGTKVKSFKPGDEVFAQTGSDPIGTFAEYIAVDEANVALKPKSLSMEEAASVPLVALTAWQALFDRARIKQGDKVFVQAGSGGVGVFAIQLAKHAGATVATTAGAASAELVKWLGADTVIDYRNEDFARLLSDYDVVLNSQDAAALTKSIGILKPGGRVVSISGPPDPAFASAIGANWFVSQVMRLLSLKARRQAKRQGVDYSFLFMQANGAQLAEIAGLIDAGALRTVVDRVYPFAQTNEAIAHVETGRAKGKVVIKVS